MRQVLMIGIAGAFGALARVAIGELMVSEAGFPVATYTVNILGTFLLCYLVTGACRQLRANKAVETAVTTGFLGSFTTFSALSMETILLVESGKHFTALMYVGASTIGGLVVGMLGFHLGRKKVRK